MTYKMRVSGVIYHEDMDPLPLCALPSLLAVLPSVKFGGPFKLIAVSRPPLPPHPLTGQVQCRPLHHRSDAIHGDGGGGFHGRGSARNGAGERGGGGFHGRGSARGGAGKGRRMLIKVRRQEAFASPRVRCLCLHRISVRTQHRQARDHHGGYHSQRLCPSCQPGK